MTTKQIYKKNRERQHILLLCHKYVQKETENKHKTCYEAKKNKYKKTIAAPAP